MMDMLRRVLMSLEDSTVDEEVEVNISPALSGMMGSLYAAHMDETFADFAIHLKDGGVLRTNRMFACMFFGAIEDNVSQTALNDPQRDSYPMLDINLRELGVLIKLMCGQTKKVNQAAILHLLPIAKKYGVPKLLFNSLVSESLRPVLDELAELKREEEALQYAIKKEQLAHFLSFKSNNKKPIWCGYSKDKLSEDEKAGVKIDQYYFIFKEPPEVATKHYFSVLVVSDVVNGKVFVRYGDGTMQQVEEVDIGTFHLCVDFSDVTPRTVYPAARNCLGMYHIDMNTVIGKTIEFSGPDTGAYKDKIGHFCVHIGFEDCSRRVLLFVGVFDESSIWAFSDGRLWIVRVIGPGVRWSLVDSIKSYFASSLSGTQTRLILDAPETPCEYDAFPDQPPVLVPGGYVGCLRNFWGSLHRERELTVALFLGDAESDHVYLFVGGDNPGVFTALRSQLVHIEYD